MATLDDCIFCRIARGEDHADIVFEDDDTLVFLDHRPVFPGHCLVIPRQHFDTMLDLPPAQVGTLFVSAQLVARAVEQGLQADGAFVGVNNRVSQAVPHVHVHVVPRRWHDGLRGFFWPRQTYADEDEIERTRRAIRAAIERLRSRAEEDANG